MTHGTVNAQNEAIIHVRLRGPGGAELEMDFVVDTGFNAFLTLPGAAVSALDLPSQSSSTAMLADGSEHQVDICVVEMNWDSAWRTVPVLAFGSMPLLGMHLLEGHRIQIDVIAGGLVEIASLA